MLGLRQGNGCIKRVSVVPILVILQFAIGCQSKPIISSQQGHSLIRKIEIGMTREEVINMVGNPTEQQIVDGTEFLFYYVDWINKSAAVERSPVALVNGKVIAMGKSHYEQFLRARGLLRD